MARLKWLIGCAVMLPLTASAQAAVTEAVGYGRDPGGAIPVQAQADSAGTPRPEREAYEQQAEQTLAQWSNRINELAAQAQQGNGTDAQAYAELSDAWQSAQEELAQLTQQPGPMWDEQRPRVEAALQDLEQSWQQASAGGQQDQAEQAQAGDGGRQIHRGAPGDPAPERARREPQQQPGNQREQDLFHDRG